MPLIALLAAGFFVAALLYASVGFGGGSTYAALLALSGLDYRVLPLVALACNIVVVAGSTVRFARAGVTPWRGALTLTALAAPAAFVGGLIPIEREAFLLLLGGSLVLTGVTMLIPVKEAVAGQPTRLSKAMPAATASLFILVNSLFGLAGQMLKHGPSMFGGAMIEALPLLIAVAIGGQIGSLLALKVLPLRWIRWLTAALVMVVGVRLLFGA